jgi:hypothetical protein
MALTHRSTVRLGPCQTSETVVCVENSTNESEESKHIAAGGRFTSPLLKVNAADPTNNTAIAAAKAIWNLMNQAR